MNKQWTVSAKCILTRIHMNSDSNADSNQNIATHRYSRIDNENDILPPKRNLHRQPWFSIKEEEERKKTSKKNIKFSHKRKASHQHSMQRIKDRMRWYSVNSLFFFF